MYWDYFKYTIKHKWYVFNFCIRKGMFIHAFTHDLSKFLPSEFIPYAKHFYGKEENDIPFRIAVLKHYHRNKHHFAYWIGTDGKTYSMPRRYVKQMIADWQAMSYAKLVKDYPNLQYNYNLVLSNTIDFYKQLDQRNFSPQTRYYIKKYLGILGEDDETS